MSKVAPSLGDPTMATFCVHQNSLGTSVVLQEAIRAKVEKIVYSASSTFYGDTTTFPFAEDIPFRPSSPYATSKYEGELLMSTFEKVFGIATLSLRFFMVYGPRQPDAGAYAIVTGKFFASAARGDALTIEGDGRQFRDFIHVKDVARACVLALQSSARGIVINIGSGLGTTIQEVADLIFDKQTYVAPRRHDLPGTLADTRRAEQVLQFRAVSSFRESILSLKQAAPESRFAAFWGRPATRRFQNISREERNAQFLQGLVPVIA
jgi:nucleoside-diphosphate-sugar epimerase